MGLKFSGTNYEDQNGIEKYIKDGIIIMSPELESTIAFMDEKHSEEFIKKHRDLADQVRLSAIYEAQNIPLLREYIRNHYKDEVHEELRAYLEWLNGKKKRKEKIKRRLYVRKKDSYTEDFRFFKIFLRTYWMRENPDMLIIRDIQRRLLEYLESEITDELAGYSFSGINLNWDDLNDMDKPDAINCVQYFMLLTQKYGPVDVSDKVYDFVDDGVYVLDMIKLKSGVRKNFVALHQYEVEMPESRQKESIIQKK